VQWLLRLVLVQLVYFAKMIIYGLSLKRVDSKLVIEPGECPITNIISVRSTSNYFFFNDFLDSISPTHNADLNNTGGREAGSATAAAFLADFVPDNIPYAHFDIAGVGGIFPQDGFHWSLLFLRGCLRQN